MSEIKFNIFTFFYKIQSKHSSDFIIEMSTLKIKPFIKQLNKDYIKYQKDRKHYKPVYEIIELNDIEIKQIDKCHGSQQFADDIYKKFNE